MKKQIIKRLSILASIIAISNGVNANEIKPYIGIGYQMSNVNYSTKNGINYGDYAEDNLSNINIFGGIKFIEHNTSIEINYFKSKEESKANVPLDIGGFTTSRVKIGLVSLDAVYTQKIKQSKFNALFIGGLSRISFDAPLDNAYILGVSAHQNGYGLNLGLGLEANIYQNTSLRGLIKYTTVNGIDYFDNLVNYNLGIKYQF